MTPSRSRGTSAPAQGSLPGPARNRERSGLCLGPALIGAAVAGGDGHRAGVGGGGDGQAQVVGSVGDGAVAVEGPLLVGAGVAVPQLDAGSGAGAGGGVEALAEDLQLLGGGGGEPLVGVGVTVVDLEQGAVGGRAVRRVHTA